MIPYPLVVSEAGQTGVPEFFVPFLFTFCKRDQAIVIKLLFEYVPYLSRPKAIGGSSHCEIHAASNADACGNPIRRLPLAGMTRAS